jgi:hypothetical protein
MKWSSLPKSMSKMFYEIDSSGQCYKLSYDRKLQIFVISSSVCPWQALPA